MALALALALAVEPAAGLGVQGHLRVFHAGFASGDKDDAGTAGDASGGALYYLQDRSTEHRLIFQGREPPPGLVTGIFISVTGVVPVKTRTLLVGPQATVELTRGPVVTGLSKDHISQVPAGSRSLLVMIVSLADQSNSRCDSLACSTITQDIWSAWSTPEGSSVNDFMSSCSRDFVSYNSGNAGLSCDLLCLLQQSHLSCMSWIVPLGTAGADNGRLIPSLASITRYNLFLLGTSPNPVTGITVSMTTSQVTANNGCFNLFAGGTLAQIADLADAQAVARGIPVLAYTHRMYVSCIYNPQVHHASWAVSMDRSRHHWVYCISLPYVDQWFSPVVVYTHELLHNLGIGGHANWLDGTTVTFYGDRTSVMGSSWSCPNAPQ
eukprot:gene2727-3370_t